MYRIPFNRACVIGPELEYLREALANDHISGDGPFTKRCQELLEQQFATRRALLTTSCTAALEIAARLCDFRAGDEVIMPSYTFVSTANAAVLAGAVPVFVDIREDTLNIDEELIEAAITERTRAIFPVHYAGIGCEMGVIIAIAKRYGLLVVEDAAQGVFACHNGEWLGTIGDLGCYSFHETKNFSCGEGGALLVNSDAFIQRAEILREKGTNRSQFLRGQIDKYSWVDVGSSYVLSDMLAGFLLGQLENMLKITARRAQICEEYRQWLEPLSERGLIRMPFVPSNCRGNHHMFYVLCANIEERTALIGSLGNSGILAVFHYVPLHSAPRGHQYHLNQPSLPITDDVSARLLRLPLYYDMSAADVRDVVREIYKFYRVQLPR
jgi:dTDP-4-amino-4,6-dideoxygalactose transaminase